MCEYERREPDRHHGHVVQVSVATHNIRWEVLNLHSLLFTGLLINRSKVKPWLQWLHTVSFFHAAFEALAVNELRFLQLKEDKVSCPSFPHSQARMTFDLCSQYGVELDVPAATILSTFGLRAQSFWWPNISLLGIFFVTFTAASFAVLHFFVRERR